jgi:GWxTD domain-containing protein
MASDPDYQDVGKLLVLTYRDAGDLDAMQQAIRESDAAVAGRPGMQLLLAYSLINAPDASSDMVQEGVRAYWQGLDAIETEQDANLYWHDLRAIVTKETDGEFRSLPVDRKPAYIRSYWQRLADQSFVDTDERLAEHYRRLQYVMANFRLDLPSGHYLHRRYVPTARQVRRQRVIYLRHGPPDDGCVHGPEFERNRRGVRGADAEPLLFHFVSNEDVQDYS